MRVSNLTPKQLDYLVCQLEKEDWYPHQSGKSWYSPTTNWKQGGPIIEKEGISIGNTWDGEWLANNGEEDDAYWVAGQTPLIAAMRCYVASKLGDEVDIPKELI